MPRAPAWCPPVWRNGAPAVRRDGPRDRGLTDSLTPAGPPQRSAASRRAVAAVFGR